MNRPLTRSHIPAPKLYSEKRVRCRLSNKHSIHVRISRPLSFSHLHFMFNNFFFNRFRNPRSISSPNSFHLYRVHLLLFLIFRLKKKDSTLAFLRPFFLLHFPSDDFYLLPHLSVFICLTLFNEVFFSYFCSRSLVPNL